jgi:hypothetical protein
MNNKKYVDIVGLPSGEVLCLSMDVCDLLVMNKMIDTKNLLGSVYYTFDDDKLDDIIYYLSNINSDLW